MSAKTLIQLKQQFLEYLEIEKGRSRKTLEDYNHYLDRFLQWSKFTSASHITSEAVRQYRLWLNRFETPKGETLHRNTQNYHLIALRSFLKYLSKQDIKSLAPEKIELAKTSTRQVEFLEADELKNLLEAPLTAENEEIIKLRDITILNFLFSTGLRVSELVSLKRDTVNLKRYKDTNNVIEFTVRGKGSKLRVVFLSPEAQKAMVAYLAKRTDVSPYLFIRHDFKKNSEIKNALTSRSMQRIIEKYAKIAGITKKVSPHTLRHSYATDLLLNGADIRSVQSMLGHSSITTTQIYTHITSKAMKDVFEKFHNKSNI
jgi:site-specific recombinase XerD